MSARSTADHPVRTERAEQPPRAEQPSRAERTGRADRTSDASRVATGTGTGTATGTGATRPRTRDADGMAVASFLLGLVGLLAMNLLLGPASMALAVLALRRGTTRPGRARLGFALGVADLVVLVCLVSADHTWSWSIG
ncbi:hypothetical protein GCM10010347_51460 [Streptomyces cirratus]|uniref:DUF4190 domain-containing protein n=1 Tax=Streptomyces cirratus TaxID=68187 RepID=A0ABQ3EYS3_9ACTN|nr:hypothetical protein [Streptomyces cirratus]GHB74702.1 hypothetical protein GCM10010347_51460 [Streptomyces cirratus]